jgi:hypothetical protein
MSSRDASRAGSTYLAIALAAACCGGPQAVPSDPLPAASARSVGEAAPKDRGDVTVRLARVLRSTWVPERGAPRTTLAYDVYLDRGDRGLTQPDNESGHLLASSLPAALRPDLLYASEPADTQVESGMLCDRQRFPHRCELSQLDDADAQRGILERLLKIRFEDGHRAAVTLTVPVPPPMRAPAIVEPRATPAQGAKLQLAFTDVGAQSYEVVVRECKPYRNDGINPCLDEHSYTLLRDAGALAFSGKVGPLATVESEGGLVRLDDELALRFEEKLAFEIHATQRGTSGGVELVTEVHVPRAFAR